MWKVNRCADIDTVTLDLLNQIRKFDSQLNIELTWEILGRLLNKEQKGIRLPMASTILRFKNPSVYQIIDQRVYRFIYGQDLKYTLTDSKQQITIYLEYLNTLRRVCNEHNINFEN